MAAEGGFPGPGLRGPKTSYVSATDLSRVSGELTLLPLVVIGAFAPVRASVRPFNILKVDKRSQPWPTKLGANQLPTWKLPKPSPAMASAR